MEHLRFVPIRFHDGSDGPTVHEDDLAALFSVVDAHERAVTPEPTWTSADVRSELEDPTTVREGCLLVYGDDSKAASDEAVGGTLVGAGMLFRDSSARRVVMDAFTVPGIGDAACGPVLDRLLGLAAGLPGLGTDAAGGVGGGWTAVAHLQDADTRYRDVLASRGFQVTRRYWRMRIDIGPDHQAPAPFPGLALVPALDEQVHRRVHAMAEESFAQHYGFVPRPFEEWREMQQARLGDDPSRTWLVTHEGRDVGLLICDGSQFEQDRDYIRTLGVVPAMRGRGIASWLLQYAFADAARRGLQGVELSVDSANATGAVALYERVGMRTVRVFAAMERPMPAAG